MARAGWLAAGAAGAALAGAWAAGAVGAVGAAIVGIALLASAMGLALGHRWRAVAVTLGAGGVLLRLALPLALAGPPLAAGPLPGPERSWIAEVRTSGATRDGLARATLLLRPDPDDLAWPAHLPLAPWLAYAWLPRYPALAPGDRFVFRGRVEPPVQDGSGFAGFLETGGFHGTVRVDRIADVTPAAGPMAALDGERRRAADLVARALPEPEGGLAIGILIGLRERVSKAVSDPFSTTGLSHVVAISGWNIALVGGVAAALLGAIGLGRRSRSVLVVLLIALYALLSGASASVVRAALMGGVAIAARATGRPGTAATALGVAVWVLLLVDPAMAADIGFQLSVTATAGLLAWGDPFTRRLAGLWSGRMPAWLAETLGVSLAAQLATLPLVLFHFGRLSLISPLANLLVAPLVAPAMVVSLLGLMAGALATAGVPVLLLAPVALAARLVLGGMIAIAGTLAEVPLASVTLPPPADVAAAAAALLLVGATVRRGRGRRPHAGPVAQGTGRSGATRGKVPLPGPPAPGVHPGPARATPRPGRAALVVGMGVAALLFGGAAVVGGHGEPRLSVAVLDVGQGDAILVEGPRGSRMLVDGGPDPDRLLAILDARLPPWDRRLDLLVLTHPHEDHVAGLALLMERYRVGRVAENGMLGSGPGDAAFRDRLSREGRLTARLAAGDRLRIDGMEVLAWWPRRGAIPDRAPGDGRAVNDTSVVLDLRYGTRRFLLMGDAEDDVDPELLAAGIADGRRLDLLKVAHHGSRTASSAAFLAALRPRVAVASAGTGNPYGHPAPSTLQRLEEAGARVLRTDRDGTVTVSTDGRDLRLDTTGGRAVAAAPATSGGAVAAVARSAGERDLAIPGRLVSVLLPGPCLIPAAPRLAAAGTAPAAGTAMAAGPPRWSASGTDPGGAVFLRPAPPVAGRPATPAASGIPCYDRTRDDPHPVRSGRHPARPRRARHARAAHARRGGGRRVPGGTGGGPWRGRGPCPRGERRAAARPGQGAPRDGPAAPAGAWPRGSRLAGRA